MENPYKAKRGVVLRKCVIRYKIEQSTQTA